MHASFSSSIVLNRGIFTDYRVKAVEGDILDCETRTHPESELVPPLVVDGRFLFLRLVVTVQQDSSTAVLRHNSELHVLLVSRDLRRLIEIPALPQEVVLFGTLKKKELGRTGFKGGTIFHSLFQGVVKVLKRVGQGAIQETWVVCCGPSWGQI
jgi:hypothetical protein